MTTRDEFVAWAKSINLPQSIMIFHWSELAYQARQQEIDALKAEIERLKRVSNAALDSLDTIFTDYEEGADCYEDPEELSGYLGKAIRLDDDEFNRCVDLLNRFRPRSAEEQPDQCEQQLDMVSDDARDAARYRFAKYHITENYYLPGGFYLNDEDTAYWDDVIDESMKYTTGQEVTR